jgi:hypothetical protein
MITNVLEHLVKLSEMAKSGAMGFVVSGAAALAGYKVFKEILAFVVSNVESAFLKYGELGAFAAYALKATNAEACITLILTTYASVAAFKVYKATRRPSSGSGSGSDSGSDSGSGAGGAV